MTELKTLKDLINNQSYKVGDCYLLLEELKAEAIEWVKEIKNIHSTQFKGYNEFYLSKLEDWIRYFFNLTEEDLK